MRWLTGLTLLMLFQSASAAPPHLDLEVTLDPQKRAFQAKAELTSDAGSPQLQLNPLFKLTRSTTSPASAGSRTPRRFTLEYSGTLPPLPRGDLRSGGNEAQLYASPEGSYLSPGAGWYPDPGVPFTYRLKLSLPAGQKGLAPGTQTRVSESGSGYTAEYEFAHPAEGVWIMTGPFEVSQNTFPVGDGKSVTVRTWFHAELSGLSAGYLQDSGAYLQRYSRLIGDYPYGDFSIVSSPLSHGLGIPSLTYIGRDVLRLPFIRTTSLGHEVLHNWWGNGVYPEWNSGNWSEGLTTFMADYAFREDQSEQAASEMRLGWLRDLTGVAAKDETSLAQFKSRQHGISSIVGYSRAAMLFVMLRDEIGRSAFDEGLRLFWQEHRFRVASWKDLEAAFSKAGRRDLSRFFEQWVQRPASPQLVLAPAREAHAKGSFRLMQQGEVFDMLVPLRVRAASGASRAVSVRVRDRETLIDLAVATGSSEWQQVELDPELRLWRRLDPSTVPPIFREVFVSPRSQLFLANKMPQWSTPATALAGRLLETQAQDTPESELLTSPTLPALVIGDVASITRLLPALGIAGLPEVLLQAEAPGSDKRSFKGSARAWTARAPTGKTFAFVMADSPEVLVTLQRSLPHYGRQSWLVFQEGRVIEQGSWPVAAQSLPLASAGIR